MTPRKHHSVYVIRLSDDVLDDSDFSNANPQHIRGRPCVYVGSTGLTVEERYQNHKRGYKSCDYVTDFEEGLMYEEFASFNPMTYEDAVAKEKALAAELRKKGYAVWQK